MIEIEDKFCSKNKLNDSMFAINDIELLKGSFLIASPIMNDARFKKTIVFMVDVKSKGSFGFVINNVILDKFKKKFKGTLFEKQSVFFGGPIDENKIFLIHSIDCLWSKSLQINNIAITSMDDVTSDPKLPIEYRIVAGYANWQFGQLEHEFILGIWLAYHEADTNLLFNFKCEQWKYCMKNLQINSNTFSSFVGHS